MNRKDLVSLLELVKPALADTNLVPVFTCFAFNQKTVSAYNDVLGIVANCDIGDHPFAVNGNTLIGLLQHSQAEEVEFQVGNEDVAISTGRSDFKLPYFNETEFLFEEPEDATTASIKLSKGLTNCIEICRTTSSSDSSAPALMGVCFNFTNRSLYSCDGDSITKAMPDLMKGGGIFTAPNSFCDTVLKICAETDTYEGELLFSEGWAVANVRSGFTIYGRLIENNNLLDHQKEIDDTLKGLKFDYVDLPMGFNSALSRARVVADAESAKTTLTVKKGKLKLHTQTHMGVVKDELSMRGHEDVEANVHASLVQRSIAICDKMAILEGCTTYALGTHVLQIVGNIGE